MFVEDVICTLTEECHSTITEEHTDDQDDRDSN